MSIKFFERDCKTVAGPVAPTSSESMRNDLLKEVDMSQARESLLVKLRDSYGKVHKLSKPGA